MAKNKINIHQAYYGEVNRAHSCINQTIDDTDITSFLIAFTDRPAALLPGIELRPYLSGVMFSSYYIFTKTFSDPFATRAGMVFTHVLIFNLNDIKLIHDLEDIVSLLLHEVPKEKGELKVLSIDVINDKPFSNRKSQPHFVQQTISSLLKGKSPILFSGDIKSFQRVLQQIWNFPNVDLRVNLKFRISFTPSDIKGVDDLTIVSIQKEFLQKWSGQNIIQSENQNLVDITSHSEALFFNNEKGNPFYTFLIELNVEQNKFQNFGLFDKVFNDYIDLNNLDDANQLRQNIRILSKFSPLSNDGKKIKNQFINRLKELIKTGKDTNLKALRNIEWKAFSNGETTAKQILSDFIKKEFSKKTKCQIELLSELLEISINEEDVNWWHDTVHESFKSIFLNSCTAVIKNLWKLIDDHKEALKNIFNILPSTSKNESILRTNIPTVIKKDTVEALELISKKRKWYLLHADILLQYLKPDQAIISQLQFESVLKFEDSIGIKYLSEKLNDEQQIETTLLNCDSKLLKIAVERVLKNEFLLKTIDIRKPCWLDIWSSTLEKTKNISYGIEGKEKEIICSILDLIIIGEQVSEIIIELISDSDFNDISNYENRSKCWNKLPKKYLDSFMDATLPQVVRKFLSDEIDRNTLEKPLVDKISSDTFMTNFLSDHRNNIKDVMKVYEAFTNLKDSFLSDFIKYYQSPISKNQSRKLGILVSEKQFGKTAKSIYDKSRYNNSFKTAFEYCRDLVNLSWWDELWNTKSKRNRHKQISQYQQQNQISGIQMIESLPTVVILTAIKEEYLAVRKHLNNISDADQNNTVYEAGIFEFNEKQIAKIIIRECGAKNTNASQETERAIQHFKPDCIFFVGIAGSRKPSDFSVGDVIFPEKIYSYEGGKSEKESFKARPDFADTDYSLKELAKKERIKGDWKVLIKKEWPKKVKADIGIIASGEQIVEHYNSEIGEILTEHYNDASVVEMEGFGFAKAANRQGRQFKDMLIGLVRGVSDIIEQPQNNNGDTKTDRRPDDIKKFASDTAAAFTFWLIFKTYERT